MCDFISRRTKTVKTVSFPRDEMLRESEFGDVLPWDEILVLIQDRDVIMKQEEANNQRPK